MRSPRFDQKREHVRPSGREGLLERQEQLRVWSNGVTSILDPEWSQQAMSEVRTDIRKAGGMQPVKSHTKVVNHQPETWGTRTGKGAALLLWAPGSSRCASQPNERSVDRWRDVAWSDWRCDEHEDHKEHM